MPDVYNFRIGEYDLTVTVTHENIRLSFSKSSDKGISEFMYFVIPIESDEADEPSRFTEFIKHCDEQNKSEFPFVGGE